MIVVVPLGSSNKKFLAKYPYGKNLAEINRRPMIEHVHENLSTIEGAQFVFVIRKEDVLGNHLAAVLRFMSPGCQVVIAEGETAGSPCTALLGIEHFVEDQPLIIANGDQILCEHIGSIVAKFQASQWAGGTIVFDSIHPRWSYVKLDEQGFVIEAAEKTVISRHATAGFYYFQKSREFVEAAQSMIRKDNRVLGRFFVCPVFNEMVLRHQQIGVFEIPKDAYFSLATPRDIEEYETFLKQGVVK